MVQAPRIVPEVLVKLGLLHLVWPVRGVEPHERSRISRETTAMTDTVMGMLFSGLYVTYFVVVRNSLTMLDCITLVDGSQVLEAAPSMICGPGTEQARLSQLAWVGLLAIGLGVPVAFLAVLLNFRNKIMRDQQLRAMGEGDTKANPNFAVRQRFKALYQDFRPEMFYWRIVMILRKLVIAIVAMLASEAMFQASVTAFVIFFAFVLQTTANPFLSRQGVPTQLQELSTLGDNANNETEDLESKTGNRSAKSPRPSSPSGKQRKSSGGGKPIQSLKAHPSSSPSLGSLASVASGGIAVPHGGAEATSTSIDEETTERIVECLAVSALRRHGTPSAVFSALSSIPASESVLTSTGSFDSALSRFSESVQARERRIKTVSKMKKDAARELGSEGVDDPHEADAGLLPSAMRRHGEAEGLDKGWSQSMKEMSTARLIRVRQLVASERASITVEGVAAVIAVLETSLENANIKSRSRKKRKPVPLTALRRVCECFMIRRCCCCLRRVRACKTRSEVREEMAREEGADLVEFAKLASENPALAHVADFNNLESRLLISALLILLIAMVFSTAPFTRGDLLYFGLLILTGLVIGVSGSWFSFGVIYEIYRSLAFAFVYDRSRGLEGVLSSLGVKISDAMLIMTDMDKYQQMKAAEAENRRTRAKTRPSS